MSANSLSRDKSLYEETTTTNEESDESQEKHSVRHSTVAERPDKTYQQASDGAPA